MPVNMRMFYILNFFGLLAYICGSIFFYAKASKMGFHKEKILFLIFLGYFTLSFAGKIIPLLYQHFILGLPVDFFGVGYMSYSSILIFILLIIVYCKINKWSVYKILDIYALANLLQGAINRIGCFLNGCCAGKVTTLPWGCRFPAYFHGSESGALRHPTQIYSSIADLILFFILLYIYNKKRKFYGEVFWLYVFYYSLFRFFIEFIRTNPVFWLGLTHAQWFSLVAIIMANYVLRSLRKNKDLNKSQ